MDRSRRIYLREFTICARNAALILVSRIRVDSADINVGHVLEPAPLDVRRPFEREGVADTLVESPAPATSNVISGRPVEAMKYGHEAMAPFGAPVGTPAPQSTPLGEATPVAEAIAGRDGIAVAGRVLDRRPVRAQQPNPNPFPSRKGNRMLGVTPSLEGRGTIAWWENRVGRNRIR